MDEGESKTVVVQIQGSVQDLVQVMPRAGRPVVELLREDPDSRQAVPAFHANMIFDIQSAIKPQQ
jgi:hypothetical protein